jgi:ATP phosphoribosyltransferase
METGISPDRRCFDARSYEATICLLMAQGDRRPPERIRSVATPYPNMARRLLRDVAPAAEILTINGSSEALVPGIADACLDLVETGTSAALNALAVRQCFHQVTTHLVRSDQSDPTTVAPVVEVLEGAMEAVR